MYSFNKIKSFIHYFLPAWIFIFFSASAFAQSINFKGIVIDAETKAQLSHVTITLTDSQNVETNNSNLTAANGSFKIKGVAGRQYKITLTSAGYKDTSLNLPSLKSSYDIGVIPLISLLTPLEKVEVLGVKPLIEQEIDRLKYNVSADPESSSSNALDILRKIPVLTIDGEDNILLNGNTNYRILVNGKPSLMFMQNQADIFRNLDAAGIKTIEVISLPSSKYQSEGIGGIINIITDKKGIGGLNAGLNIRKSTPENISGSANAVATLGKFSISGNGAYSKGVSPSTTNKFTREDNILKNKMILSNTLIFSGRTIVISFFSFRFVSFRISTRSKRDV